jgi:uncharacterized protein YbaP (TraB family)
MDDAIKKTFNETQQLYLEIDLSDSLSQSKLLQNIAMKDGHKLTDYVSKNEFDSACTLFQNRTKMPLSLLASYKPFLLVTFLYPSMMNCVPISFEMEFIKMAKQQHIPVKGLETIEFQLSIFDEIPYKDQTELLMKSLYNNDKMKQDFFTLVERYKQKDINALQESVSEDNDFGKYDSLLINKRNNNWVPIIEKTCNEKPTFIAVGAGHLGGNNGVIALLKKDGYEVTPVMY